MGAARGGEVDGDGQHRRSSARVEATVSAAGGQGAALGFEKYLLIAYWPKANSAHLGRELCFNPAGPMQIEPTYVGVHWRTQIVTSVRGGGGGRQLPGRLATVCAWRATCTDHDPAIVVRLLHLGQQVVVQVLEVNGDGALRPLRHAALRRREAQRACVVAVEPDVDALEQPRPERRPQAAVGEPAPRRRRQAHTLPAAVEPVVPVKAPGQLVVVVGGALVDVEVDAVDGGVAERAIHAVPAPAEVRVPEVVGDGCGGGGGREGVAVPGPADGEEDEDVPGLAVLDVGTDAGERVAGEVAPVAAVPEDAVEGDDDGGVEPRVAGLAQRALAGVLAPEHGQLARLLRRGGAGETGDKHEGDHERVESERASERHGGGLQWDGSGCCMMVLELEGVGEVYI
ncbi:hypothetical protein SETIT_8G093500v2 [Setaria italica]|uniref:Uncharacterized protein n=1 Tax=Setaria italica TaxID=4555 RepID=A0A368S647_SETIT|nr:hypothetical protein SETIT_8G093500v2 [Setaria italica]